MMQHSIAKSSMIDFHELKCIEKFVNGQKSIVISNLQSNFTKKKSTA